MGYPGISPSRSRFVSLGLAHVVGFHIFMGLVMILEPRMRGSYWRGWELISFGVAVIALALFLVGIALLMWAFLRHLPSRSKRRFLDQTSRSSGVWDRQLDG
jgi:hypothetical protein